MSSCLHIARKSLLAAALGLSSCLAMAQPVAVMDFEGLENEEVVQNFYNGGTGSLGSSGVNLGVEFLGNTTAYIASSAGGTGNVSELPSPSTVITFLEPSSSAVLNVAAGFTGGFSFYYSSDAAADVVVYDGLDGTGDVLATVPITAQRNVDCTSSSFCNWTAAGASFSGTARSVSFGGTANQTGFDNITLGRAIPGGGTTTPATVTAVPTLGEWSILLLGVLAAATAAVRLRRA